MALVLGIDPGTSGALALYDTDTLRLVGPVQDVPTWHQTVGRKKRKRVDLLALATMFEEYELVGLDLIVMEAVGVRPNEGAVGAFAFGYGVGILYTVAFYSGVPLETVAPGVWKQMLRVPGKTRGSDDDIMNRADEMFGHDRDKFRGARGGKRVDRAEAAMIAKYGGDFILPNLRAQHKIDVRSMYQNADTGA